MGSDEQTHKQILNIGLDHSIQKEVHSDPNAVKLAGLFNISSSLTFSRQYFCKYKYVLISQFSLTAI